MTEHEERDRAAKKAKIERKRQLGMIPPSRKSIVMDGISSLQQRGVPNQEIYEFALATWNFMRNGTFQELQRMIGGEFAPSKSETF